MRTTRRSEEEVVFECRKVRLNAIFVVGGLAVVREDGEEVGHDTEGGEAGLWS